MKDASKIHEIFIIRNIFMKNHDGSLPKGTFYTRNHTLSMSVLVQMVGERSSFYLG